MISADRFRIRASEYVAEAATTVDAEQKTALLALAQRWSRLASELDAALTRQRGEPDVTITQAV
jgi:hypothetical protein